MSGNNLLKYKMYQVGARGEKGDKGDKGEKGERGAYGRPGTTNPGDIVYTHANAPNVTNIKEALDFILNSI